MEENINKTTDQAEITDEKIMDHDYDGIKELDNPPPRWIMAIFYITIGFSIIYGAYYFFLGVGDNQDEKYAKKSIKHDQKYKLSSQSADAFVMLTDQADLDAGKVIYDDMMCYACHGENGEGNEIGPNLTDEYWLHGGDFISIFNIVKNGQPDKGMTPFKGQISDTKIQQVSSYVMSLQGTDPPNARAPQGEKVE